MVQVTPVSPKKLGGAKNTTEGRGVTKSKFIFPEPSLERENLSKKIQRILHVSQY